MKKNIDKWCTKDENGFAENKLIELYCTICQCNDSRFREKLQRLSNNNCPQFTDARERKGIHFHGLCILGAVKIQWALSPKGKPITDKSGRPVFNMTDWALGFSTCVPLDVHYERAVSYVTKYITKADQKIFGKWYLSSRALRKKPDIVTPEPVDYNEFRSIDKLNVHIQSETVLYSDVLLISEEFPKLEGDSIE